MVCFFSLICSKNTEFITFNFKGIFDGTEIRKLINVDEEFAMTLNEMNYRAWIAFKELVHNFFGNRRSENYHDSIDELLSSFKDMHYAAAAVKEIERTQQGRKPKQTVDLHGMSVKLHYLHLHRDKFPGENEVYVY